MVRHITAALYFRASVNILPAFSSPDSRLVELIRLRPGAVCRAASATDSSVVSITRGTGTSKESLLTIVRIISASSLRSVVATLMSNPCAPKSNWSCATCMIASKSSAKSKRLKAFEPCAFIRSPMIKGAGICSISTAWTADDSLALESDSA